MLPSFQANGIMQRWVGLATSIIGQLYRDSIQPWFRSSASDALIWQPKQLTAPDESVLQYNA